MSQNVTHIIHKDRHGHVQEDRPFSVPLTSEEGESESLAMSQKAVTDIANELREQIGGGSGSIRDAIDEIDGKVDTLQQKSAQAEQDIADLQEGLADAGKVDDVKVNGISVLNSQTKEANIEITASVVDNDTPGDPTATATMEDGNINIEFAHVKGERGNGIASITEQVSDQDGGINTHTITDDDGQTHAIHTRNGRKGDQGDSAVYDPDDPDVPDFVMANGMGDSTTKSMTQKAITDEISRIDETLATIVSTHNDTDFSQDRRTVNCATGEYSNASTDSYAVELSIDDDTWGVTYPALTYLGNYGYAFMDGSNNFVTGAKHTSDVVVDGYVNIGRVSILGARTMGATKLRITINDNPELNKGYDVKTISLGGRLEDIEGKVADIDAIRAAMESLEDDMEGLSEEVSGMSEALDDVGEFQTDESSISTHDYDESTGRNVDSNTGDFSPTSVEGRHAGEYLIKDGDTTISYYTTKYNGNYGWALLDAEGLFVHGEKTANAENITIDLTLYPTAKIFRWSGIEQSKTIAVYGKETKQVKEVVKASYETFGGAFDGTLNFHFTFAKPAVNNQYATDVEKLTSNIMVNGAGLLRLAKNYSRDGLPTPLIIFFIGSTGYSSYSTSEFKEEYLPYIDYLTKCGYNVMSAHGFYEGVTSRNFACPVGLAAVSNAYKWVAEHYNISKEGVYVYGRSFGGSNVVSFGYNSNIKTRAAAMFNCFIGDVSNEYSNSPDMVKEFIFDNDPDFEWTTSYVTANLEKALPWSNLLRGIIDFGSRSDMVYALMQAGNTMNPSSAKYKDPTTIHRYQPFPLKMWTAEDDSGITNGMKWYRQTVIGTGGRCELRIMPSNYTDGTRVPESIPHHICDTAGPVYETLTTKLGYECENVPVAYKEMVDWFDNN